MAEYLVQDTSLTSVADKIRVLSGSSSTMNPASMAQNVDAANNEISCQVNLISQITSALADKAIPTLDPIVDALVEKGQDVPADADVGTLAALIAAIEAGGGGDIKITAGTYTPSEDTENLIIERDFGGTPFALIIWNTAGALDNHIRNAVFILTDSGSSQKVKSIVCAMMPTNHQLGSVGPITNTLAESEWCNGYIRTPTLKQGYTYYMRASVQQSWEVYAI